MEILKNIFECVGCASCAEVCPKQCISLRPLEGGFLYPVINTETCIDCGKCKSVCPVLCEKKEVTPLNCYALADKVVESRMKSASGGASNVFATEIVRRGGAFCGVKLDETLKAVHDVTHTVEALDLYRDSKYVQSDMSAAWRKIAEVLKQGKTLLVSGTPCQIAAVKTRFGDVGNLITCDLICSGVPDPKVFELYLSDIEEKDNKKIKEFYFRDKTNGWRKSNIRVVFEDGTEKVIERKDSDYFRLFGNNIFFRKACYSCKFKNFNTCADLTVGDYWGIEKMYPLMDDKGCSVVIVNTEKGQKLFEQIAERCEVFSTPIDFAIETHLKLVKSIPISRFRGMFYDFFCKCDKAGYHKAVTRTMGHSLFDKIYRKIYLLAGRDNRND